jgi:hypothetical protein
MPHVSRDANGNINGVYANLQPGYGEEYLPDDDPELLAFLNPPAQPPQPSLEDQVLYDHENRLRVIEGQPPLTLQDFIAKRGA